MGNKILYIIPGYRESTRYSGYQQLKKIGVEKGYKVILWEPTWKHKKWASYGGNVAWQKKWIKIYDRMLEIIDLSHKK